MLTDVDHGSKLAEMLALHRKGLSQRDVAEAIGMSQRWVCCALKDLGLPPNGYRTKASRKKRSTASAEVARLRRFREAGSLIAPEPWWEAEWPLRGGGYLSPAFGCLLFAALCRVAAVAHGEPRLQLAPLGGSILARAPESRVRALAAELPAGKVLRIRDDRLELGPPTLRPCRPASSLDSWCVTMKGATADYTDPAMLESRLRDELGRLGMGSRVRLNLGDRRVVRVKGVSIVGYGVSLSRLNPRESLVIQASGLGGRRRFGCGVFVPC